MPASPRLAVLFATALACSTARAARAESPAAAAGARIVDVGVRPIISFPDAIGITVELHPLGGGLALEGSAGLQPLQSAGLGAALKYRFTLYRGETTQLSVGPGIGSLWLFDSLRGPFTGQLLSAFAAVEAVFWGDRVGFRLALDAGVAYPVIDRPNYGNLSTYPVFNGSVGLAFRTSPGPRASGAPRPLFGR